MKKLFSIILITAALFALTSCASLLDSVAGIILGTQTCIHPGCTNPAVDGSMYCGLHGR